MAQYPLAALSVQPQQQPGVLDKYSQLVQLKGLLARQALEPGQAKLQQQQIQANQQGIDQQQRAQQDQQAVQQVLGATNGDLDAALPQLAGKVSPQTFIGLDKFNRERKKEALDTDAKTRAAKEATHNQLLGLIDQAEQLPPDAYAQNAPGIVEKALEIMPELKGHIDPLKPPSQQQLGTYKLGLLTETQFLAKAKAAQDIAESQATLPGKIAKSQMEQRILQGTSASGITAQQQAQLDSTKRSQNITLRGQNLQQQKRDVSEQAIETAAQSLANGDLTRLKDIASLRGDQRLLIYNRAKELNPKFNTGEIDRKIKMEDSFTNGKDGQNLQSFGTFLEHAGEASRITNEFRNTSTKLVNTPLNKIRDLFGDEAYTRYIASLEPVRKEFEGFLLGGRALYGDDRKAAEKILSDNSSPAQIQEALKQMGHTVKARFNESNFRYKRVMGHDLQDAISPEAMQGAQQIGVNMGGKSAAPAAQPVYARNPKTGERVMTTDGGQSWQPAQ